MERVLAEAGEADAAADFRLSRLHASGDPARVRQFEEDLDRVGPAEARRLDLRRELEQLLAEAATQDPLAHHPAGRSIGDGIALAYSDLGEWSHAVDWLERAYARKPGRLRRLLMDHPFDRKGLATEQRYIRLLRIAGLDDLL